MNGYRLSKTGCTEHPFTIESVGLNLTSVEELLYFLETNAALIDGTVVSTKLTRWLREEFGLDDLALRMERALKGNQGILDYLLPLYTEFGWFTGPEARHYSELLTKIFAVSKADRLRMKADALCRNRRYGAAIAAYHRAEEAAGSSERTFLSEVCRSAGYAAIQLMEYDEAAAEFERALKFRNSPENLRNYLMAVRLGKTEDEYLEVLSRFDGEEEFFNKIEDEIENAFSAKVEMPEEIGAEAEKLRIRYHKEAGT